MRRSSKVHFYSYAVLGCPLKLWTMRDGVLEYGDLNVCECLLECDNEMLECNYINLGYQCIWCRVLVVYCISVDSGMHSSLIVLHCAVQCLFEFSVK